MNEKDLHPTVREFKGFLNKHPKLIEEIRKTGGSWQEHYEKWILLGESDPVWEKYRDKQTRHRQKKAQKQPDIFEQVKKLTGNIDINKVQTQVNQLNKTINVIQEVLNGVIENNEKSDALKTESNVFSLFRD